MHGQTIEKIQIDGLFGDFRYSLPGEGILPNSTIFYGDNGVGKSTILRIVFHMLSAAKGKGHRNALIKTVFDRCIVTLSSSHVISAERRKNDEEIELYLYVALKGTKLVEWKFNPKRDELVNPFDTDYQYEIKGDSFVRTPKKKSSIPQGETAYLELLEKVCPALYYLNAERRLDSDVVADPSDEIELRRAMRMEEPKRIQDLVVRSREIALAQALTSAARWVQKQAVRSTNEGSTNVHSVYVDVVRRLTLGNERNQSAEGNADDLLRRPRRVSEDTANFAKYELTPALETSDFHKSLRSSKVTMAADFLNPYIKSLESRLDALQPIYAIIDDFVQSLNRFLVGKSLKFTLSKGFEIENANGKLLPRQLSSGEQQLILLFCYVLVARDRPSVFMIDEPEISLNVKWQRKLLQSLQEVTQGADIQFILASHSMELIAQRRSNVVRVGSQNNV